MAHLKWWQRGVIYQIYPRSFQDTNNDGVGDLPGIIDRLDHLVDLGADAIWISPIYPSPMADFGYDVSNYCDIAPIFGTLTDLNRLIAAAHARKLKVILDFVANHTSDQHRWFQMSRSSRTNEYRDWYIWRDPPRRWPSEQLAQQFWRFSVAVRRKNRPVLLPFLLERAARPQLAQSGNASRHVACP